MDSEKDPVEKSTEQTSQDNTELEKEISEEPADAVTKLDENADIETDTSNETPAGDEPVKGLEAGDAPLDEDGVPITEEDATLPLTAEGVALPE